MSAYVVNREHIRFLVSAAQSSIIAYGPLAWTWKIDREKGTYNRQELGSMDRDGATRVGQMLWDENIRSVQYRYPDCVGKPDNMPGPIGESFIYAHSKSWLWPIDPVAVLKACDGYEYQSCEHPEWKESEAFAFIEALREAAIRALPGYDEATWEMDAMEVK